MKRLVGVCASFALVLVACERPLEPRSDLVLARTRLASAVLSDRIAYRFCYYDWDWETVPCLLKVANGDGTESTVGDVFSLYNEPTWSPDASKIAVDDHNDILVVSLDDGSVTNLTQSTAADHSAAWSPDGARIAFASDRDGEPDLYLMNATDGSEVTRVTGAVGFRGNPAWFPDGRRLVFDCEVESGNSDLCAINADGTGFARLTTDPAPDNSADVSPDGARIVFSTGRYAQAPTSNGATPASGTSYSSGSTDIAVMDASGANVTRLTTFGNAAQPDWSPGGGRIAFTKVFTALCDWYCESEFYIMNADGSSALRMDYGQQAAWRPAAGDVPPPQDRPPVARIDAQCRDDRCYLSGMSSTDDYEIIAYDWNFGDGSAAGHEWSHEHTYAAAGTHTVTLTVFDAAGQSSTATTTVTTTPPPDLPPIARFSPSCVVSTCTFRDASVDDHGVVSRAWSFGDGATAGNVLTPTHTYSVGATYSVMLTVTDAAGQTNSVTYAVRPLDHPPMARFTSSCVNLVCTFDASASTDDVGLVYYTFDFGDGSSSASTGSRVTVQFRGASTLQVKLTVLDRVGQTGSTTQTVVVQ